MPTEELVYEYRQVENLLRLFGTHPKDVISYAARLWIENRAFWNPYSERSPLDVVRDHVEVDFFYDHRFDRHESKDLRDARAMVTRLAIQVFMEIMPILDVFQLPDFILQTLHSHEWLGDCLVIATAGVPRMGCLEYMPHG